MCKLALYKAVKCSRFPHALSFLYSMLSSCLRQWKLLSSNQNYTYISHFPMHATYSTNLVINLSSFK